MMTLSRLTDGKCQRGNLLKLKISDLQKMFKSLLNGVIVQDADISDELAITDEVKTDKKPTISENCGYGFWN
jgi:hypothetical protein